MKPALWVLVLAARLAAARQISNEEDYREQMREIDHSFSALQSHRLRRTAEVEEEATRLARLFATVEAFWKGRGDEEAAGFARMAKEGAEQARDAARKKDEKALDASIETVARSCQGCHKEPLDKYRIPQ